MFVSKQLVDQADKRYFVQADGQSIRTLKSFILSGCPSGYDTLVGDSIGWGDLGSSTVTNIDDCKVKKLSSLWNGSSLISDFV